MKNNQISKVSEVRITKKNEKSLVEDQSEIERGADCRQLGLVTTINLIGQVEKGINLDKSGKQGEDRSGGILFELDQNRGSVGMCVENRKHGSWKRRARANQVNSGKENEKGKAYNKAGLGNKRGFSLRDEDDVDEDLQNGKKLKGGAKSWQIIEI